MIIHLSQILYATFLCSIFIVFAFRILKVKHKLCYVKFTFLKMYVERGREGGAGSLGSFWSGLPAMCSVG